MSTLKLIVLALLCGMAILIAFAVQVMIAALIAGTICGGTRWRAWLSTGAATVGHPFRCGGAGGTVVDAAGGDLEPLMHRRAAIAASVICLPLLGTGVARADHHEPTVDEQQAQVEANQQRQDELAAQIGLLQASDVDLQLELDGLVGAIALARDAVRDTDERLSDVRGRLSDLEVQVAVAGDEVDAQQDLAVERAVASYINPRPGRFEVLVGTSDLSEIAKKDALLTQVAEHDRALLDGFEAAAAALVDAQVRAGDALAELESAEADAAAAVAELEATLARQEAVREVLAVRIAEFRGEADVLAAEEDALQAIIADRLRPPPTTAAPTTTTTTAPPSTTTTTESTTTTTGTGPPTTGGPTTSSSSTSTTTTASTSSTTTITAPPDPGYGLIWPLSGPVTSPFGPRWGRMHNGIDVGVPTGTPIVASAAGEVFHSGWMGGYGNVVLIDHFNGLITLYAHQSELASGEGDQVAQGDVIGYVGSTGNSTGPHLHYETRVHGVPQDPMAYLP